MKLTFNLGFESKQRFFDRAIADAIEPAFKEYLSHSGAYVRKVAQRSLRRGGKKKKSSPPGQPPRHHMPGSNEALRRIFYTLARDGMSVDIGPVRYPRMKGTPVPKIHEFGEIVTTNLFRLAPGPKTRFMFEPGFRSAYPRVVESLEKFSAVSKTSKLPNFTYMKRNPVKITDFELEQQTQTHKYPARPFMQPALSNSKTQAKLKELWAKTIARSLKRGIKGVKAA